MRLPTLDAKFIRLVNHEGMKVHKYVDDIAEAQGLTMLCPACFAYNGGPRGTHSILIWFHDRGVPADEKPLPGRWTPSGTSIETLTLLPGSEPNKASVYLAESACQWHGHIKNGQAI